MSKNENRFWKGAGKVSADMSIIMILFTGALVGLVFWIRPSMRRYKKVDLKIFEIIKRHTNDRNTLIMSAVTFLGKHQFLIPANLSLIFYFLFIRKRTWFSIRIAVIALSSLGMMFLLKHIFKRKRPQPPLLNSARGLSFPSGHAMMSVSFYGLLVYIISQTFKKGPLKYSVILFLIGLIQLIGLSRVYLRVHYASDVAVGYLVGLSWLLISLDALKRIEEYNKLQNNLAVLPMI